MEHKIYYSIELYKELINEDGTFNNDEEPISLRVEDEEELKVIVSAAARACCQVVVTVGVN
jgi:hypothetical protein